MLLAALQHSFTKSHLQTKSSSEELSNGAVYNVGDFSLTFCSGAEN